MASSAVAQRVFGPARIKAYDDRKEHLLTKREEEIARRIINGLGTKDLVREFNCSIKTIQAHRYNIGKKLGTRNQFQLVLGVIDYFRGRSLPLDWDMFRPGID